MTVPLQARHGTNQGSTPKCTRSESEGTARAAVWPITDYPGWLCGLPQLWETEYTVQRF